MKRYLLTIDTDFVSEEILDYTLSIFYEYDVKLNVFTTNDYSTLKKYNNIQIFPHPNFDRKSSHGETIEEVESYFSNLSVSKKGYRSHKYICSNDIDEYMIKKGYLFSSNTCTNMYNVQPFILRSGLLEFPIYFEDGGYLKFNNFDLQDVTKVISTNGITTLLFHPFHIALNSNDFYTSRTIKDSISYMDFSKLGLQDISFERKKEGIETFLRKLLSAIDKRDTIWFSDALTIFNG